VPLARVTGVSEDRAAGEERLERLERLERIGADLADVEVALVRLDAGTYWTCEVTGRPLPDELLTEQPAARRLASLPAPLPLS